MTDFSRILKVPDVDDIFVNHIHAAFQGLTSKGWTRSEATPISYVCRGTRRKIYSMLWRITHDFVQLWGMRWGDDKNENDRTYSMEAKMTISWSTLCAMDHARNAGVIRGLVGCTWDDIRRPADWGKSALTDPWAAEVSFSIRFLYSCFSINTKDGRSVFRRTPTEEQLPENIAAGTSLGSLWNWERHKTSYFARALAPGSSCPPVLSDCSRVIKRSNLVNTIKTGTMSYQSLIRILYRARPPFFMPIIFLIPSLSPSSMASDMGIHSLKSCLY